MSQPTGPVVPPEFQPPMSYGGYGGDLQGYRQQGSGHPSPGPGSYPPLPPSPEWVSQPQPLPAGPVPSSPVQRPAVVGLATTLAATASLQWVCLLSFCWLVATVGASQLGTTGADGVIFHILNRFHFRMLEGLAWPLYLFPVVSFILSFVLLARRPWARIAFTVTGVAAVMWSGWWLRHDLLWWLIPAGYIAITVLVLWTTDATRWYRSGSRSESHPAGQAL